MSLIPCPDCGGLFPDVDGPTHRYLGASPGCWACFGDVLAREYSDLAYYAVHRLTVDAYALQHPGKPALQTIRSVALHGITLCAVFERGVTLSQAGQVIGQASQKKDRFVWLPPPASPGPLTVADVLPAGDAEDHARRVRAWATAVWQAWAEHHPTFRQWLAESWAP